MRILKPLPGTLPMPERNIVADWPMSSLGDRIFDFSGNRNTGTEQQDTIWQPGKFGPTRYFSGDDYITVPDDPSQDLIDPHTIIIYAKPLTLSPVDYAFFVSKRGATGGNYQAYARNDVIDGRRMYYWNGAAVIQGTAATAFVDNQLQQFGFVHDGTNINFYLDGILMDSQVLALGIAKRETLYMNYDSIASFGKSNICHIDIYNRDLAGSEMQRDYRESFYRYPENRVFAVA